MYKKLNAATIFTNVPVLLSVFWCVYGVAGGLTSNENSLTPGKSTLLMVGAYAREAVPLLDCEQFETGQLIQPDPARGFNQKYFGPVISIYQRCVGCEYMPMHRGPLLIDPYIKEPLNREFWFKQPKSKNTQVKPLLDSNLAGSWKW